MPKKIQNLSINVQDLMKLSPSQKIDIFQSTAGAKIVSQLTPEQYASIFPRFFLDRMRYDVSGFTSALSPEARDRLRNVLPGGNTESSTGSGGARQRQSTATSPSIKNSVPSWMKELEKEAPGASDAKAKATFSPDQQKVLDELRKGQVSADDPRLSFINKLSPEDRQRAGIQTIEQDGKQAFTIPQTQVTRQEVEEEHKKTGKLQGGSFSQQSPTVMNRLMKDFNLTKEQAAGIIGNLGHESSGLQAGIQEKKPIRGRGGLGWAQWTGPRRRAFEKYLEETGQSANDPEANYGFLKKELETTESRSLTNLRKARTVEEATHVFERDYERAGIKHMGSRVNFARQAMGLYNPDAGTGGQGAPLTEEEAAKIEQKILSRRREESEKILSGGIERPELPQGLDSKFVEQYNKMPIGQAQKVSEAISKLGPDKFNEVFRKDPQRATETATTGTIRQTDYHQIVGGFIQSKDSDMNAGGSQECATLSKAFNKEAGRASSWANRITVDNSRIKPGVMVATTSYNDGSGGRRGSTYHTGIAITQPDSDGNFKVLEQWKGRPARIGTYNVNTGYKGVPYGVVEGADKPSLTALEVARRIAEERGDRDTLAKLDPVIVEYRTEIQRQRDSSNQFAEGNKKEAERVAGTESPSQTTVTPSVPSPVGTPQESFVAPSPAGSDSRANAPAQTQAATPATSSSPTTQAATPATSSSTASQSPRTTPATSSSTASQSPRTTPAAPAQVGTPQESFTAPAPASQARTAVPSTQQEASDDTIYVPAFSEGGNEEVKKTKKVEAYSIDHDNRNASLKGDDAVVVDAKSRDPLFTMNTTRETAVFDPATQSISVTPVDQSSDNESKPKSFVSVSKPDALSVPIFSMDTNDGTAKKYDPSTKNVNKSGTSDVKMKNNQKNSSSQISKANVYVKDKESLDNFVPVLAEGGEVDVSAQQNNSQPVDNNVSVSNMGSMQTSEAQATLNPALSFSMAANPSFECPSFVRACGAVNGQRSTDPFGGHYDKFASNLA